MMKMTKALLCACCLSMLGLVSAFGQLLPLGEEFTVNSYTPGTQARPWLATGPGGEFVVVWDNTYFEVSGRRFADDGTPMGMEFQVNSNTTGNQQRAAVDVGPGGEFVVIWQGGTFVADGQDGAEGGILGQRYASNGSPVGGEFQVNTYTTENQRYPAVAIGPSSEFVVTWDSLNDGTYNIQAQRYAADGSPQGAEFPVNSYATGSQMTSSVDISANGEFMVVWRSFGSPGNDDDGSSVQAQRFSTDGNSMGAQFQVNEYTWGSQSDPRIAFGDEGEFVVVWASDGSPGDDSSSYSIQGQRFDTNSSPLGNQFQINTFTTVIQRKPALTMDPSGGFTISWASGFPNPGSPGPDGSLFGIAARPYTGEGIPASDEFVVNTFTYNIQYRSAVGSGPDGHMIVVWESFDSPAPDFGPAILGQRFVNTDPIFPDGFESGDTSAWSNSVQ